MGERVRFYRFVSVTCFQCGAKYERGQWFARMRGLWHGLRWQHDMRIHMRGWYGRAPVDDYRDVLWEER